MISIAICEDELMHSLFIKNCVETSLDKINVPYTITTFSSGTKLTLAPNIFDIILLDIKMKELNGIEAAKVLRNNGCRSTLIFITSAPEFMPLAFDVEAFHYVLKPIDTEKLESILTRAVHRLKESENNNIVIKQNRQSIKIPLSETLYFEIMGRVVKAHLIDRTIEFYEKISTLEQKLPTDTFFRCHKSYIVNLANVNEFDKQRVVMDNGEEIPIARLKHLNFNQAFLKYIKQEGSIL